MLEVINEILNQRKEKQDVILIGIIEASGSLPRKKGAYMVVGKDGRLAGTVGGGNLEFQAIQSARQFFAEEPKFQADHKLHTEQKLQTEQKFQTDQEFLPNQKFRRDNDENPPKEKPETQALGLWPETGYQIQTYELTLGDSAKLGMVCGGRAKLLFYPISGKDDRLEEWLEAWKLAVLEGQDYDLRFYNVFHNALPLLDCDILYEEHIPGDGVVYIFGAGHLAREVVPLLAHLDFRCVVMDDREEFADSSYFPEAREVLLVDFNKLEQYIHPRKADYLVIMTRGHEWDMAVEAFGLKTQVGYIGVVGSRKKTAFVNKRLEEQGFTQEELKRIITPIGLNIRSETPAEIAVSIAAQLIEIRARKRTV